MYTLKYGEQGEHIPENFIPSFYTEREGGKWLKFPPSQQVTREQLANCISLNQHIGSPLYELHGLLVHSLLVPAPNLPLGWFLRWDLFNGWGMSLYLPELTPPLGRIPPPASSPFSSDLAGNLPILRDFERAGKNASFHFADDSGREWHLGYAERDKAIALWRGNKHLTQEMLEIGKHFLWSFSTFVESEGGKDGTS